MKQRVLIILLALLVDLLLGDPPNRFHPVAGMGCWFSWGRNNAPSQGRFWFGLGCIAAGLALLVGLLRLIPRFFLIEAILLKLVFSYRNLRQAVIEVQDALATDNLPSAQHSLGWHLVSRDTSDLSAEEVAGATIESLAENLTDSVMAPLLIYSWAGLPATWAYRFINTADAMWGYRTPELEQLGKFSARFDDLLNYLPARVTGWLLVAAAALVGENGSQAAHTMLTQHQRTASPNAGWTMSAMAGALEVTLTKRGVYKLQGGQAVCDVTTIHQALQVTDVAVGLGVGMIGLILLSQRNRR